MEHLGEYLLLVQYLGAGALNWGIFGVGLFNGRNKLTLLERKVQPLPDPAPRVSVLIPAKNEGPRVAECIRSALAQDYPNFEVFAIDDRSTDQTGTVMDEIAATDPKLRVVHIKQDPPAGWTGKCNVLHRTVSQASGQWLMFIDSDVTLTPIVMRKVVEQAAGRGYGMLSLILDLEKHSFWESLVTPLASSAIMGLYAVPQSNQDKKKPAFANGQFILIRRDVYEAIGGHEAVRDKFSEDVEIARLVKAKQLKPRVSLATDYAKVRMYNSLGGILRGWARNFFGIGRGSVGKIIGGMIFTIVAGFSGYAAAFWTIHRFAHPVDDYLQWLWLAATMLHLLIMTVSLGILYKWSSSPRWFGLLFPLGGLMLMVVYLNALKLCLTKKVTWRGDQYSPLTSPSSKPDAA